MQRQIDPPRADFDRLPTNLTAGERQVIDLFDRHLQPEWEIYVQPHLNGLRPDIVLLNPHIGVAVFEVKDWDLSAMRYSVHGPHLYAENDRERFTVENPIDKIRLYKDEIFELYCPRADARLGRAVITAGLVFTKAPGDQVRTLLEPLRDGPMREHAKYYPIAGREDLQQSPLDRVFPEWRRTSSTYMNPELAEDLRSWLREPAFAKEARIRPISLDQRQRDLVGTRTRTGYRRLRGAAGSGKSVVLACRAAELARQGHSVLVVCYNITLLNYLRDLAVRHTTPSADIRRRIDFLNFHQWCKRVCTLSAPDRYQELWSRHLSDFDHRSNEDLDPKRALDDVADLVQDLYRRRTPDLPTYDAVLVDEGQDFDPRWWETLRQALKPGGEMMLVADKTQDVYGTASAWTDATMQGCGFAGPWSVLKRSYRLPKPAITVVRQFGERFLKGELDLPIGVQTELDVDECDLRWVHVENPDLAAQGCIDELRRLMGELPQGAAMADLTFLCSSNELGRDVVAQLEREGVRVRHTFDQDRRQRQRQKRAFFQGDPRVKATTIHSYKGWEGKALVVFVKSADNPRDKALLYTAMTRLRKDQQQSSLTVVSACRNLRDFGESWPKYREYMPLLGH